MGFFVICAGVVLLQLSKSAKDVPDTAVFAGDLDQVRTIAEQEQPESEPKADAIRGAAAIVRRFSQTRQKMEMQEARRLHEEKQADLEPIGENEQIEWDGLRRRRTTIGTNSVRSRGNTTPFPPFENPVHITVHTPQLHPPLGMSRFPSDSDSDHEDDRPTTASTMGFFGRAKSIIGGGPGSRRSTHEPHVQSPMHPVPLTEISIPAYKVGVDGNDTAYYGHEPDGGDHRYGLPSQLKTEQEQRERHITIVDDINDQRTGSRGSSLHPSVGPTPPPHSARRQFSFQNVFRKGQSQSSVPVQDEHPVQSRSPMIRKGLSSRRGSHGATVKGATEEERLGLVKGDTNSGRQPAPLETYNDEEEEDDDYVRYMEDKARQARGSPERGGGERRDLTPPRRDTLEREKEEEAGMAFGRDEEERYYEEQRRKLQSGQGGGRGRGKGLPPPPPPFDDGRGGAFI